MALLKHQNMLGKQLDLQYQNNFGPNWRSEYKAKTNESSKTMANVSEYGISTGLNKDADSGTETLESSDADSEGESSDDGQKLEINNDKYLKVPTLYDNGSGRCSNSRI